MKKKKKAIITIVISVLIILLLITGYIFKDNFLKASKVKVYNAQIKEIEKYISEEGEIKAQESEGLYSKMTGYIDSINYDVGDEVNEGDLIARFDSTEIDLNIEIVKRKIETLEANKNISEIEVIKTNLEEAERKLKNAQKLLEKGAITQDSYNELLNQYNVLEEKLELARRRYAAENTATDYQLKELYAQLDLQKNNREKVNIYAGVSGVITDKLIEENQAVNYGQKLFNIADIKTLFVEADILTKEIREVQVGNYVEIENEDLNIKKSGQVSKIYPKAFNKVNELGVEQKRIKIEITPDKLEKEFKLGFECDVNILVDKVTGKIVIPDNSLFNINGNHYVFAVINNKVEKKEVETIFYGEEMVAVNGINEGDMVIISPTNEIEEGMKVDMEY